MKKNLRKMLPENVNDIYFWFLTVAVLMPFIYITIGAKYVNYMMLNFALLLITLTTFLALTILKLIRKNKLNVIKNPIYYILFAMICWLFISGIFSQNSSATWLGKKGEGHGEISVFQYLYYFVVATLALLMDKKNIKHLFYIILFVINTFIIIQIVKSDYSFGFINKNHTGYYLSISVCLSIGMFIFSNNLIEKIVLGISMIMHFTSLVLNNSLGPILGLIAFFVISLIYYLIHNRKVVIKLVCVILSCIAVFSFFDFVPKVNKLKDGKTPVITQLVDVGFVALNKACIISDETYEKIMNKRGGMTPGADGYERLDMWKKSIDNMIEFPIFGVGVGAWYSFNPEFGYRAPHNEYLELGAIGGIPALLFYLALILTIFIKFRKSHKNQCNLSFVVFGAIVSYLVQAFFGNIMPFTAPIFYLMLGLAIKFVSEKEDNNQLTLKNNNEELVVVKESDENAEIKIINTETNEG